MKTALMITTFNRPTALHRVLESVAQQTRMPDQVIICDDGSDEKTAATIAHWTSAFDVSHVWQPNLNFRAARARNLGALKSNADYLIWIDGDCLVPPQFIARHLALAELGYLVAGGRHLLTEKETDAFLSGVIPGKRAFQHWKFRYVPANPLRDRQPLRWQSVRTCNLGVYRDDLVSVGGFDESFIGWGREDSDFVVRLLKNGVRVRSGRFAVCVAHLHHLERPGKEISPNEERFQTMLGHAGHVRAHKGVFDQ